MATNETGSDYPRQPSPSDESPSHLSDRTRAVASANHEAAVPPSLVIGLTALFEGLALAIIPLATEFAVIPDRTPSVAIATVAAGAVTVLVNQSLGNNEIALLRHHALRLGRVLFAWTTVFGLFALAMMLADLAPGVGRYWYPVWYAAGFVTEIVATAMVTVAVRRLTRAGRLQRRAVIVGGGPLAESLIGALNTAGGNEIRVLGIFDDRNDDRSPENQMGYPKLGSVSDLVEFARVAAVDVIIVALPPAAETRILQLLKKLWVLPVDIRLAAHSSKLRLRPRSYSYIGRVPFLDLFDRPIAGWDSIVKRIFDVAIAVLAIVVLSPLLIGAAIAVRATSKGPILFRQKRYGFNNEVIEVMKFRSMYQEMADYKAVKVVTRGDPRVTPVGRFIRKTSIDELPQLFNVLKGELSLVGPRPHAINAQTEQRLWEEVVDGYFARHKVKPGVTGWAQINGWRGEVDSPDKIQTRVDYDLYYIEHWSVAFDFYILLLTPIRILNQENAY